MSDFPRWTDADVPPRLRSMIDAARAEAPPDELLGRSLGAIAAAGLATTLVTQATTHAVAQVGGGAAAGGAALGKAAAVTKLWGGSGLIKWGFIGLAGGAVAIGAVDSARRFAPEAARAPQAASAALPAPRRSAEPWSRTPAASASTGAETVAAPSRLRPLLAPSLEQPGALPSGLAVEIGMIERARAALRMGRSKAALVEADAYAVRFPQGQFGPEMAYIRMESLAQLGDRAGARQAARELIEQHPSGPQRLRAQQLLEEQ